jgi:ubiquinone/menaquinone biosynthesis C-methylase UbiE
MKPSPINEVRDMYDATADSYAEMMNTEIGLPVYADTLRRLRTLIADTPGALIDTACGSGHMLSMYHEQYDPQRVLVGIDASPGMVSIAQQRLGSGARIFIGDMRKLSEIVSGSAAAVLNWYAIHHLEARGLRESMREWFRVLAPGGHLFVAAWEGVGRIDYGDTSSIIALRHNSAELAKLAEETGFTISRCAVEPVEDFPMDAVYLECKKTQQPGK